MYLLIGLKEIVKFANVILESGFYWIKYLVELAKERLTVDSKQIKSIAIIETKIITTLYI